MQQAVKEWIDRAAEQLYPGYSPEEIEERKEIALSIASSLMAPQEEATAETPEELVKKTMAQVDDSYNDEEREAIEGMLKKSMLEGASFAEAIGIDEHYISWIYMEAYKFYKGGKYADACTLFLFLEFLCPEGARFSFGAGASYHHLGDYERALAAYFVAAMKDRTDPMPYYHMADCYMELGEYKNAYLMLIQTLGHAKGNDAYDKICERAKLIMGKLEQEQSAALQGVML